MEDKQIYALLVALRELVNLKEIKETEGETPDYLNRKPLAWATAKRLVRQHKDWGVRADTNSVDTP